VPSSARTPAGTTTATDEPQEIVLTVVGEGLLVVNVEGPTP
jgi:hypothetical protein